LNQSISGVISDQVTVLGPFPKQMAKKKNEKFHDAGGQLKQGVTNTKV